MKFLLSTVLIFSSFSVSFAKGIYCAPRDAAGGMLKVDLENMLICMNGGAPRADFCTDQWTKAWPMIRISEGSVAFGDKTYAYDEYIAKSEFIQNDIQVVRIYKNVIESQIFNSQTYNHHHADLTGAMWTNAIVQDPGAEFLENEHECVVSN